MKCDIIIIGAGPVGLMLANLLEQESTASVVVIEKELSRPSWSRAIGVTPPSLEIFESLDLAEKLIESGVKITTAVVHNKTAVQGSLSFTEILSRYQFILSVPQSSTETILEENLRHSNGAQIYRGTELIQLTQTATGVFAEVRSDLGFETIYAPYVVACDGAKSAVRDFLGVRKRGGRYRDTFVMGDFVDRSDFGSEAHFYFTKEGAVESFPLPEGKRRWVVESSRFVHSPNKDVHVQKIRERTGIVLDANDVDVLNPFGVQHFINNNYRQGRIFFCGDSAHVMSPIGGQGMNTGFADAEFLAVILSEAIESGKVDEELCDLYERSRRRAARSAITRAWISMRIGTAKGVFASIRDLILKAFLNSPLAPAGANHYSMLTIPDGTIRETMKRSAKLSEIVSKRRSRT